MTTLERLRTDRVLLRCCQLARMGETDAQRAHEAAHWLIERVRRDMWGAAYELVPLSPAPARPTPKPKPTPRTREQLVEHMRVLRLKSAAVRTARAAERRAAREAAEAAAFNAAHPLAAYNYSLLDWFLDKYPV